ncbi:copper resistance CopC family protein [Leucobacter sp. Z1108]|uniref:copper resistance CopC family protein n=1 Tax=Leucobacter sp. Z1108 TaxID=3439066 RepID=UPI003F2AA0AC
MRAFTFARVPARPSSKTSTGTIWSRISAIAASGIALGALTLGAATPALAHDELVGFDVVAEDSTGAVRGVSLQFSNEILDVGAEFIATDESGADVLDGLPVVAGRDVTQALQTPLTAGDVAIAWRVVSSDGHPISGALTLAVSADGIGTIAVADAGAATGDSDGQAEEQTEPEVTTQAGENALSDTVNPSTGAVEAWVWALVAVGAVGVSGALVATLIARSRMRARTDGSDGHEPGSTPTTDSH